MTAPNMDNVIDALDRGRQRATYGAVAALLGTSPRTLMKGRQRDARHSWVVSHKNGAPTGYTPEITHPELLTNSRIIGTRDELEEYLSGIQ